MPFAVATKVGVAREDEASIGVQPIARRRLDLGLSSVVDELAEEEGMTDEAGAFGEVTAGVLDGTREPKLGVAE